MGLNAKDFLISPNSRHLVDNPADRRMGERWERNFCLLAAEYRKMFTPHQISRTGAANASKCVDGDWQQFLLPDVTVWTAPGEHHEIKHKNPTGQGRYGLEKYRLDALVRFRLETNQPVLYTIHDWQLAGATSSDAEMPNDVQHWVTVDVLALDMYITEHHLPAWPMRTWVNGEREERDGYYWPTTLWQPLEHWWNPPIVTRVLFELPPEE